LGAAAYGGLRHATERLTGVGKVTDPLQKSHAWAKAKGEVHDQR